MNWTNVRLIFEREVRDQLRDRRTLFMIFVLPILLYPLLGMSFFQIAQFVREHPTSVLILGSNELPEKPALLSNGQFAKDLFADARDSRLLEVKRRLPGQDALPPAGDEKQTAEFAKHAVERGDCQVVVWFPPGFGQRLRQHNDQLRQQGAKPADVQSVAELRPIMFHNSALEKSELAYRRVTDVLDRWRKAISGDNLRTAGIDPEIVKPFEITSDDVAGTHQREAAVWSKIFPFLVLIWALTGAFYPAVDLCAGEKERGTLETLLSSPAARDEIVWGKLLTIMAFSVATVLLNVASMGLSGVFILSHLPQFGPPPLSVSWLLVAVLPVSAMFSALCLALAAFARSTKEGQYYLMPLVLVTMPLVIIPMAPAVELNLGNSLLPITGVMLLLRSLVEGHYWQALPYVPFVVGVMLACCWFAIRWAVDQFNAESVLFRESERLDLGLWMKHLRRDREDTPVVAQAVLCGVLILVIRFFMSFALPTPQGFDEFAQLAVVTQLVVIATPALLMTIMLTRSPRKTLLLFAPPWWGVPAAVALAVLLHPVAGGLQGLVMKLYPLHEDVAAQLNRMIGTPQNLWLAIFAIAMVPAVCEELAFRGFILSGLRRQGHKWRAIALSSILFGMSHAIFQQSLIATLVGIVIGTIAVLTGSLLPSIVFHALHNGLALASASVTEKFYQAHPELQLLAVTNEDGPGLVFRWPVIALCAWLALGILYWMHRQPYRKTAEEVLQEAIDHHAAGSLAS